MLQGLPIEKTPNTPAVFQMVRKIYFSDIFKKFLINKFIFQIYTPLRNLTTSNLIIFVYYRRFPVQSRQKRPRKWRQRLLPVSKFFEMIFIKFKILREFFASYPHRCAILSPFRYFQRSRYSSMVQKMGHISEGISFHIGPLAVVNVLIFMNAVIQNINFLSNNYVPNIYRS